MTTQVVSKLGIHSEGAQNTGLQEYCRALLAAGRRPAVVDSHDNYSATYDAAQIDPTVLTIGDIEDFKDSFDIDVLREKARLNPHIKYWQIFNEWDGDYVAQVDQLIDIMTRYGDEFKFVIFNCARGTPQYPEIDPIPYAEIARACKVAKAGGHMLGLHEYGDLTDTDTIFRYRRLAEYLRKRDALCYIVITEAGPDEGTFIGVDPFMAWCKAYDAGLRQDGYIVGAALWTLGGGAWQGVNFSAAMPALATYQAKVVPVAPPPDDNPSDSGTFSAYKIDLIDDRSNVWSLAMPHNPDAGYTVLKNGSQFGGGYAEALLYWQGAIYCTNRNTDKKGADWYRADAASWVKVAGDPRQIVAPPSTPFWVGYPVGGGETPHITSHFNDVRDYGKHEGIDFDAYINATGRNAPILAAQDGIVEYVNRHTGTSYGLHVVIRHPWNGVPDRYRTLYGHLSSASVVVGQVVKRGDQIGVSGATGTIAIHLHFNIHDAVSGLKGYVRCIDCSTLWPDGVIDPEPLIKYDSTLPPIGPVPIRSVHGRADGGALRAVDVQAATIAKLNGYKLYKNDAHDYNILKTSGFDISKVLVRIQHVTDRRVMPQDYIAPAGVYTGIFDTPLLEATRAGVVWFELFNEPNESVEGLGSAWSNVNEFCELFEGVVALARAKYPTAKFLSPALSQQDSRFAWWDVFKTTGVFAVSDGLSAHCYWAGRVAPYAMNDNGNGRSYRALIPYLTGAQQIHITEAGDNSRTVSDVDKGIEYHEYMNTMEPQVARVDFFVVSSSDTGGTDFNATRLTWVRGDVISAIPGEVGKA